MFRHFAAILALPCVVTLVVPALIITQSQTFNPGWRLSFPLYLMPVLVGIGLIGGGLALMIVTIRMFIAIGQGTLAPWDPTQRLVVRGVYRHVRNPMISGVFAVLLGEAALFGSVPLLLWALAFMSVNMLYMPLVEEPGLRQRFGQDYDVYTRHVPRWIPRRKPWHPPDN